MHACALTHVCLLPGIEHVYIPAGRIALSFQPSSLMRKGDAPGHSVGYANPHFDSADFISYNHIVSVQQTAVGRVRGMQSYSGGRIARGHLPHITKASIKPP